MFEEGHFVERLDWLHFGFGQGHSTTNLGFSVLISLKDVGDIHDGGFVAVGRERDQLKLIIISFVGVAAKRSLFVLTEGLGRVMRANRFL